MRKFTCIFLCFIYISLYSQSWERLGDFIGLDSYCSLNAQLYGTSNGLIGRTLLYDEWNRLGLEGRKVYALYNELGNDTIMAGTDNGLYYAVKLSKDNIDWKKSDLPSVKCNSIYSRSGVYLVCTENGVYSSTNMDIWTKYVLENKNVLTYEALNTNDYYGFVCSDGFFFTKDNGAHFINGSEKIGPESFVDLQRFENNIGGYNYYYALGSKNSVYVIKQDSLLFGLDPVWERRGAGLENQQVNYFGLGIVGTNEGLFTSQDTGRHYVKNPAINVGITSYNNSPASIYGSAQAVFTTLNGGIYQNSTFIGYSNIQTIQLAPDGSMFIGTKGYGIFQFTNNGQSYSTRNIGLTSLDVRDIEFDSKGNVYAATANGAFKSVDKGMSWTPIKPMDFGLFTIMEGFPKGGEYVYGTGKNSFMLLGTDFNWNGGVDNLTNEIYAVKYHSQMNQYLAAGRSGVWKSSTDYVAWTKLTYQNAVDLEVTTEGRILLLNANGLYYSDNYGVDWSQTAYIPGGYKTDIVVDKSGKYFVSTAGGVYFSSDKGQSWNLFSDGFINLPYSANIECLAMDNEDHLWAGSLTSGMFRTVNSVTNLSGLISVPASITLSYSLFYNKDLNKIDINMNVSHAGKYQFYIYSIEGKLIQIQEQFLFVGEQSICLDTFNYKVGLYLLTVKCDSGFGSDKFIIH